MRLTRFTDNALRCLIALGVEPRTTRTVGDIAAQMFMSDEHLMKVVRRLSQLGYVETTRGRGGGVRLAKDPKDIVIGTVVRQTEENLILVECFDAETNLCPIASHCRMAGILDDALQAFLGTLDRFTLADVIEPREELIRLMKGRSAAA